MRSIAHHWQVVGGGGRCWQSWSKSDKQLFSFPAGGGGSRRYSLMAGSQHSDGTNCHWQHVTLHCHAEGSLSLSLCVCVNSSVSLSVGSKQLDLYHIKSNYCNVIMLSKVWVCGL